MPKGLRVFSFDCLRRHGVDWRLYYTQRGGVLIVMLGGGDKSTQKADIKQAIALAKTMQE
ncbi:hypothetical protein RE432_10260 [Pusillimonas sp. SM2304]|uniref:hypothetical protein n=1 Tax=Pusillimonas sp. SM2304 TaxID=3073241 RepID=UPI0028744E05|nr:hypothetical protein [Pusillimonas sp. SM2304]MDS1140819.1 hypothetical protein [Pusillimonas sp. SM2304]